MRTTWRAPASSVTWRAGALERAQLGDRLLGDDAARGRAHAVGAW